MSISPVTRHTDGATLTSPHPRLFFVAGSLRAIENCPETRQLFPYVAASVTHFISFEMGDLIEMVCRVRPFAYLWRWTLIAALNIEMIIYVAAECVRAMKPRPSADENATRKPFRAVIAVGGASIRSVIVIAVGAIRCYPDIYTDLRSCHRGGGYQADSENRN